MLRPRFANLASSSLIAVTASAIPGRRKRWAAWNVPCMTCSGPRRWTSTALTVSRRAGPSPAWGFYARSSPRTGRRFERGRTARPRASLGATASGLRRHHRAGDQSQRRERRESQRSGRSLSVGDQIRDHVGDVSECTAQLLKRALAGFGSRRLPAFWCLLSGGASPAAQERRGHDQSISLRPGSGAPPR